MLAVLVAAAAIAYWRGAAPTTVAIDRAHPAVHPWFSTAPRLRPLAESGSGEAILSAAATRRPALWRKSFVAEWRALRWDADVLGERIPWALARSQAASAEFVLVAPDRGGSAPLLSRALEPLAQTMRNASVPTILGGTRDAPLYLSGTLGGERTQHWQTELLLDELEPHAPLQLDDTPPLLPSDTPRPPPALEASVPQNKTTLRLWGGSAGVLARTHYDKGHNLFAQVRGGKALLLWEPEALPTLHLYPAVHAAYRQSQVPLASAAVASAERFPLFGRAEPMLAVLQPGDLLYIPPYFPHAVSAY